MELFLTYSSNDHYGSVQKARPNLMMYVYFYVAWLSVFLRPCSLQTFVSKSKGIP